MRSGISKSRYRSHGGTHRIENLEPVCRDLPQPDPPTGAIPMIVWVSSGVSNRTLVRNLAWLMG